MAIFRIARYKIRPEAIEACKEVVQATIDYTKAHEPGTLMYMVMQESGDPTSFVHLSAYADNAALQQHITAEPMVTNFREVLNPAMVVPATFTHYELMDAKLPQVLAESK